MTATPSVDPDQLARHIAEMYRDVANETGARPALPHRPGARRGARLPRRPARPAAARGGDLVRGRRLPPRPRATWSPASACWTSAAARAWTFSRRPCRRGRQGRSSAWTSRPSSSPRRSACAATSTWLPPRPHRGAAVRRRLVRRRHLQRGGQPLGRQAGRVRRGGPRAAARRTARARRHRDGAPDRHAHRGPARPVGCLHRRGQSARSTIWATSRPPASSCARSSTTTPTASPASGRSAPATSTAPTRSSCSPSSRLRRRRDERRSSAGRTHREARSLDRRALPHRRGGVGRGRARPRRPRAARRAGAVGSRVGGDRLGVRPRAPADRHELQRPRELRPDGRRPRAGQDRLRSRVRSACCAACRPS